MQSRRDFLIQSSLLMGWSLVPGAAHAIAGVLSQPLGQALSGNHLLAAHSEHVIDNPGLLDVYRGKDIPGAVRWMNLVTGAVSELAVPVYAHVFEHHPTQNGLVVGAAKWKHAAVVANIVDKRVIKHLLAPSGFAFSGHCGFLVERGLTYFTAVDKDQKTGRICIYDTNTWTLQAVQSSGGQMPHECLLLPNEQICVVNKTGLGPAKQSEISILKTSDFSVVKSYQTPIVGHVTALAGDRLLLVGHDPKAEANVVILDLKTGKMKDWRDSVGYPKKPIIGEALSTAVLSDDLLAITVKDNNSLVIWDTKNSRLHFQDFGHKTYGVVLWGGVLYLTEDNQGWLHRYAQPKTNQLDLVDQIKPVAFANGKHLRQIKLASNT